jgi:hypothetical protein
MTDHFYVTFVGGVELIQVMVTNLTKVVQKVEVAYGPPGLPPSTVFPAQEVQPADETFLETLPDVFTFGQVSPGVYSGYFRHWLPEETILPKEQLVTNNIYVMGPPPVGNPVGTHGHLIRAHA